MSSTPFLQSRPGTVLRYAISLAAIGWLASHLDWRQLEGAAGLDWSLAVPGILLAGVAYPLQAWRWHLLLAAQGLMLPARWVHGVFWIGQFYNSFLPGGIAGDVVRFGYLWRKHPDRKAAAAAGLVADRLLGLGALFILAAVALGLRLRAESGAPELQTLLAASAGASVILVGLGWSLVRTRWWEPVSARVLGSDRAAALCDAATALGSRGGTLAAAAALSVVVWLVDFVALWLLARAAGLAISPLEMAIAGAAAYVAAALPLSIGGHGVREAALVAVLGLLQPGLAVSGPLALLAAAFWASSVAWSLVGGAVHALSLTAGWPLPGAPLRAPADPARRGQE